MNLYLPAGKWYGAYYQCSYQWRTMGQPACIDVGHSCFVKKAVYTNVDSQNWQKSTDEYDSKDLTIRYYPAATASTYIWFDDDGNFSKTLEKADYELVAFKGVTNGQQSSIDISTNPPTKQTTAKIQKFRVRLPGNAADALLNGKPVPTENIGKTGNLVAVSAEFTGKPLQLVITTSNFPHNKETSDVLGCKHPFRMENSHVYNCALIYQPQSCISILLNIKQPFPRLTTFLIKTLNPLHYLLKRKFNGQSVLLIAAQQVSTQDFPGFERATIPV